MERFIKHLMENLDFTEEFAEKEWKRTKVYENIQEFKKDFADFNFNSFEEFINSNYLNNFESAFQLIDFKLYMTYPESSF